MEKSPSTTINNCNFVICTTFILKKIKWTILLHRHIFGEMLVVLYILIYLNIHKCTIIGAYSTKFMITCVKEDTRF
jgi:hypothetical protein